ncbi:MAG: replication-associated recombination protein A [bacterium]|nr:replication-associated recombination protein A [bacterium]
MTSQDDLFAGERAARRTSAAPLAARMRPTSLDEVVGQRHLLGADAAFRSVAESGALVSMILWGPPGTGKTTLARLVASSGQARFEQLSAVSAGVKDVRSVLAGASQRLEDGRGRTVLFLDEIHRFTKAQQDALLPGVEDGIVILLGATTENPFFEVNSPLISRSTIFRTEPLSEDEVAELVLRAHRDKMRGLGGEPPMTDEALEALSERVGGDARLALTALEVSAAIAAGRDGAIDVDVIAEALQRRVIRYDKGGDRHYDVISAFIKSMRGSDVDASLYWLHTMIGAGEDPKFIARRMIIFASEDIGLADPTAMGVAVDAFRALEVVGLPEAGFALTQAAIHLAAAPKSNSVKEAIIRSGEAVEAATSAPVPAHLRSAATAGERGLGIGVGYRYPHDAPDGVIAQQYLPDGVRANRLYRPKHRGAEGELAKRVSAADTILGKSPRGPQPPSDG